MEPKLRVGELYKCQERGRSESKMKRTKTLFSLLSLLILTSAATPALAAKEVTKMEYTLTGMILDMDSGVSGGMLLTFSGNLKLGTPDYELEDSGVVPGWEYDEGYGEYYWEEDGRQWKAEVYWYYEASWTETYNIYEARWYSPQPTWTGELLAIWGPTSTTTFKVNLSPVMIRRMVLEGTSEGEETYFEMSSIYWWDEVNEEWVWDRDETYSDSWMWSYTYSESVLSIPFSGKIMSRGRPPLEGILSLLDVTSITDGLESHSILGGGTFGPYLLQIMM